MAVITIFNGKEGIGTIPNVKYGAGENFKSVWGEIVASNSLDVQFTNDLNRVLAPMEIQVPRINNTPLPVKVHNSKFTPGGVDTSAKEFRAYMDKFDMTKSRGYNIFNFDYSDETILEAQNYNIDLDNEALQAMKTFRGTYINKYLPFSRLKSIITGTTQSDEVPTLDSGTAGLAGYKRAFGFARGEDFADFLTTTDGVTTRNHYRTTVASTYSSTDITNAIDLITDTNMYSGKGVIALGNPRIIQNLALLANAPENADIAYFGNVTEMFGASFKKIEGFHKEFLIFLDKGYIEQSGTPLLVRGVEVTEAQRGFGIMIKNNLNSFETVSDMNGSKTRVFPEEWYMTYRLSGAILDIAGGTRADASGTMQEPSITALENWVTTMNSYFINIE